MARAGGPQNLELYDPDSGRIDARAIADELAIPVSDIARAIGKSPPAVRKTPDAPGLQEALRPLASLVDRMYALFLSDIVNVRIWLNAPNRGLEGKPPMQYLLAGRLDVLDNLIGAIEHGFPS